MTETLSTQAMQLYQRQAYESLKLLKKQKKKSWAALGINAEMEARIMAFTKVKGTVSGRLPPKRNLKLDLNNTINYVPREIHALKGTSSHGTIAIVNQVVFQEKFRTDPRFSLFQIMERVKRYKAIFAGAPFKPIFA